MTREDFKICFDRWFDELRNYMTYRCGDPELSTDIVQEAFLKVWEKNLVYEGTKTKSLLYKIANDLWITQYRKSNSEKKYRLSLSFKKEENDTENQLYYRELKKKYEYALSKLSEKKRMVFLMNRMDNLTYKEIAERLGITAKAVEKRMKLALHELRQILKHEKQST